MLAIYAGAAALVVAAAAIGRLVLTVFGARERSPLAAPVGFAVMLLVAAPLARTGAGPTAALYVLAALALAGLVVPGPRGCAAALLREEAPLVIAVVALASLPFLVSARTGILGVGDDDDMSAHLTAAQWLLDHVGAAPGLIVNGYPLGAHALAAAVAEAHVSLVHAFDAVTIAVPAIAALAALAAMPRALAGPVRVVAAGLVGLCYLAVSYLAEGAFKETVEAMLVLAFAVAVRELLRSSPRPRVRDGVPAGLLAAGTIATYSYLGAAWPVAIAVLALLGHAVLGRGAPWRRPVAALGRALPALAGGAVACAVAAAPEASRMITFASSPFVDHPASGKGPLSGPIPFVQALGVWLEPDFRFRPDPYWPTVVLLVLAAIAFAGALTWWLRRRDVALPAALGAAALLYWQATEHKNIYDAAKGLSIAAPLTAIVLFVPLAAIWRRGRPRAPAPPRALLGGARALSAVVAVAAACSALAALRDAPVGPADQGADLASLRPAVLGHPTLFLGVDDFVTWELHGVDVATGPVFYSSRIVLPQHSKPWRFGLPLDFDSFAPATLDRFAYVIEPAAPFRSGAPSSFRLVRRSGRYLLWRRTGPTPDRRPVERASLPGAVVDCATPRGRFLAGRAGVAAVLPQPIVGEQAGWRGQPVRAGASAAQRLRVPAGAWDVSLQYVSYTGLRVTAPGLRETLPPTFSRLSPFWPAGTLRVPRERVVTVRVTALPMPGFGSALGAHGYTRPLNISHKVPLRRIALTRHGAPERVVPLGAACGRYADWYRLAGARAGR